MDKKNSRKEIEGAILKYNVHKAEELAKISNKDELLAILKMLTGDQDVQPTTEQPTIEQPTISAKTDSNFVRIGNQLINLVTGETQELTPETSETSTDKSGYIQALPSNKNGFTPFVKQVAHSLFYSPKELPYQQQQLAQLLDLFFDLLAYPEPRNRPWNEAIMPVTVNPEWIKFVQHNTGMVLVTSRLLRTQETFKADLLALIQKYQPTEQPASSS